MICYLNRYFVYYLQSAYNVLCVQIVGNSGEFRAGHSERTQIAGATNIVNRQNRPLFVIGELW